LCPLSPPGERNRANTIEREDLYKKHQTIVELPYGTIKRQLGFNYILTKRGMDRAGSDVGLMFIACNLRRINNILTRDVLKEYLGILFSLFRTVSELIEGVLITLKVLFQPEINWRVKKWSLV
jgi:hypothetical protein